MFWKKKPQAQPQPQGYSNEDYIEPRIVNWDDGYDPRSDRLIRIPRIDPDWILTRILFGAAVIGAAAATASAYHADSRPVRVCKSFAEQGQEIRADVHSGRNAAALDKISSLEYGIRQELPGAPAVETRSLVAILKEAIAGKSTATYGYVKTSYVESELKKHGKTLSLDEKASMVMEEFSYLQSNGVDTSLFEMYVNGQKAAYSLSKPAAARNYVNILNQISTELKKKQEKRKPFPKIPDFEWPPIIGDKEAVEF